MTGLTFTDHPADPAAYLPPAPRSERPGPLVLIIRPGDAPAELLVLPSRDHEQAAVLNGIVGGHLETIGDGSWLAFVCEDGARLEQPHNLTADALARALGWHFHHGDVLLGPAVFACRKGVEIGDVPQRVIDLASAAGLVLS
jgi:hypothetical protein